VHEDVYVRVCYRPPAYSPALTPVKNKLNKKHTRTISARFMFIYFNFQFDYLRKHALFGWIQ
jgi:hypothetical protein